MNTTWHNPATNPPEPLRDVLLAVRGESHAAEGFCAEQPGDYFYSTGHPVKAGAVYAWTELPACPAIAEAAAKLKPLRVRSVKGGRE